MKHIEGYLTKKSNLPFFDKKKEVEDILSRLVGVVVPSNTISFSGKTIFIKTEPHTKTQILIHKKSIVEELSKSKTLSFYDDVK